MTGYTIRMLPAPDREMVRQAVAAIETYPDAVERVTAKAWQRIVHIAAVPPHTAMVLKQELLALHGDALLAPAVYLGTADAATPVLAWASQRSWDELCRRFAQFPVPQFQQLSQALQTAFNTPDPADRGTLNVGDQVWHWGQRTFVMGIINVTPDSFSGDGLLASDQLSASIGEQAAAFAAAGADILDIGGESTRPGAAPIDAAEELRRVVPAIAAVRAVTNIAISIDTTKAEVAAAALDAGAHIVNDIWGLRTAAGGWNLALAQLVAERGVPIVLMHNRRAHVTRTSAVQHFTDVQYTSLIDEVIAELAERVQFALDQGIDRRKIIIDPGLGFGKNPTQNIELLRQLDALRSLGLPLLVGTSRKSFIGLATGKAADQRAWGTAATISYAIERGADIVRVHDVAAMVDVCRMTDALIRPGVWEGYING